MNPIQSFDPIAVPSGTIITNGINKNEQLILFNSSLACLQLTFADKTNDFLFPNWVRTWTKTSPMGIIQYTTLYTLPIKPNPISTLIGTLYEPGEHITDVNGPIPYQGELNVGNTSLVNDGNIASTQFIESTVGGASGSSFLFFVDGHGTLKVWDGTNLHSILTINTIANFLQLGNSGDLAEFLGNLLVDGTVKINKNTAIQATVNNSVALLVITNAANEEGLVVAGFSGQSVPLMSLQDNTFAHKFDVDASGNVTQSGVTNGVFIDNGSGVSRVRLGSSAANPGDTLDATTGSTFIKAANGGLTFQSPSGTTKWSMTAMNGTVTPCGSGTTISHGLGVTPDIITGSLTISQPGSGTAGLDNVNSSTFQATIGSGVNFDWVAIKK